MHTDKFFVFDGLNPNSETHAKKTHFAANGGTMAKMRKWRRHSLETKREAVERMKTAENIQALARELKIERKLLYTWKYQLEGRPEPRHANLGIAAEDRKEKQLREQNAKLKAALAEKVLENDFFKAALLRVREARQQNIGSGGTASTKSSARRRQSKAN
jgi:transposase-like protein